ncbi:putative cognition protein [Trypoxylus dichotomus]
MIYPKDGKYQSKENSSEVQLEEMFSPSCSFTTKLLHTTDIGTGVAGLLSGVVFTASMFTPAVFVAAPVAIAAGGISGTYAAARSTYTLIDRRQHEQVQYFSFSVVTIGID